MPKLIMKTDSEKYGKSYQVLQLVKNRKECSDILYSMAFVLEHGSLTVVTTNLWEDNLFLYKSIVWDTTDNVSHYVGYEE